MVDFCRGIFFVWVGLNRDVLLKHVLLLAFFAISVVFQCVRLALGYSVCDCFGFIQPPSSLLLVVSSIVFIFLGLTTHRAFELGVSEVSMRQIVSSFDFFLPAVVCLLLVVAYGASVASIYSLPEGALVAIPETAVFSGSSRARVAFRNNGEVPIDVVGITRTCKCAIVSGLPVTVAPGGIESVSIAVDAAPGASGKGHVIFHTSSPLQPQVQFAYEYEF